MTTTDMDCSPSTATGATAKSPFAHLYKHKGADWKSEFRKSVNRRLRDCRNNLVDRFRKMNVEEKQNVLDRIVREELSERYNMQLTADELNNAIEEYEQLREELLQQEFDDVLCAEEQLVLEEISHYFDSNDVYCPRCQKSTLVFPDAYTFFCQPCNYSIKLPCKVPIPPDLFRAFENVFSRHFDRGCVQRLQVLVENNQMLFVCPECRYSQQLF